ncbi:MAG: VOC family protein [Flavobacterium sp.]|nr:VOC family protein [Flavobacterium sp.]
MKSRFARHTNNLEKIKSFYIDILGFELLVGFENHNNYDGIFIGKPNLDWHLEFTKSNEIVNFNFGEENYLVFYNKTVKEFESIKSKLINNYVTFISSKNPYWNENGIIIKDPDDYSIIIAMIKV